MKTDDNVLIIDIEGRDLLSDFMFGMKGLYSTRLTWNDLMPVVEKIRTLRDNLGDKDNGLAYSTISVSINADGHAFGNSEMAYRVSLLGTLVYKRMINEYQHTYDKVEVPHITKYGTEGIKVLYDIIIEFIKWYNSQNQ